MLGDDHAVIACYCPGNSQRQVVGLGAGADEHADVQRVRQRRSEPLSQLNDVLVQVTSVRIQGRRLAAEGFHHARMAMTHRSDVVIAIKVPLSVLVP